MCERLLPNYKAFARKANWDTFPILRKILDEIWFIIDGKPINSDELSQLKSLIDLS